MADIFLSYSREDRAAIEPLAGQIAAAGYTVWWDKQLTGGGRFLKETEAELNAAKVVLVVWSKTSIESHWVADEAGAGRDTGRLLPISLDGSMPPLGFRQFQVIDCSKWTHDHGEAFKQLTSALGKLTAPSGEASAAPKKAPAARPLLKQPLVLGGLAVAALALVAAIAVLATRAPAPPAAAQNDRTAFFGFTAAGVDPLAAEIAANATEETYTALGALQIGTAARGDTQDVDLNAQLDKAAALSARYALGGTVRASGDQVSVNIRLDDVGARATLWQESMTGGTAQRESLPVLAAGRASTVLQCLVRIRPDILREDASTLARVTRACQFADLYDRQWITLWRDVEQIAPRAQYVQYQLGAGWFVQSAFASDAERPAMLQEVRAAIRRRQAISPTGPGPQAALALVDIASDRPLVELIPNLNTALQTAATGDNHAGMEGAAGSRLMVFNMLGRNAEAARIGRSDAAAYPLSSTFSIVYGIALWYAGQKLEARTVLDSVVRRFASPDAWGVRAEMAITEGEDIAPILAAAPPAASVELVACWRDIASAVRATNAAAKAAGARRMQACVRAGIIVPQVGIPVLNLLGQVDAAQAITSQMLKRSNPIGFLYAGRAAFGPASRPMRADPRFLPLMKQVGIYQYWLDTKTQPDMCETPEERDIEVCRELRKDQGK